MLPELFAIVAPVFAGIGLGAVWGKLDLPYDRAFVTSFIMNIGTPFLIFGTLTKLGVSTGSLAGFALYGVAAYVAIGLMAVAALLILRLPVRDYVAGVSFPNAGNMGLPVAFYAFGNEGLVLAIGFFAISAIGQFVVSPIIYDGRILPRSWIRMPTIWAIAISLLFNESGAAMPEWAARIAELFGAIAIPLMIFALGHSLTTVKVGNLRRSSVLSVLRISIGLSAALAVAALFGLAGPERGVLALQCSMPAAVFSHLFAARYGRAAEDMAGLVVISTVLSFATIPAVLAIVI